MSIKHNDYLIDTNILVDAMRGYPKAVDFVNNIDIRVSIIVLLELIKGATSKESLNLITNYFEDLDVVYLDLGTQELALSLYKEYRLINAFDINDALIAATALKNNLKLVTKNTKHFKMIKKLKVISPYD